MSLFNLFNVTLDSGLVVNRDNPYMLCDTNGPGSGCDLPSYIMTKCEDALLFFTRYRRKDSLQLPRYVIDNMQIREQKSLGEGSFGRAVLVTYHPYLQCPAVLKSFPNIDDFNDEADAFRKIGNALNNVKNVMKVYCIIPSSQQILLEYIANSRPVEKITDATLFFATSLIKTVLQMHDQGVYHMDLKHDNILMTTEPVIIDFSLATLDKTYIGNTLYNDFSQYPPEARVDGNVCETRLTDYYAVGILLFSIKTGTYPIIATKHDEIVFHGQLNMNDAYDVIIYSLTQFHPNDRHRGMEKVKKMFL